jgi:hypothetical protein
VVLMSGGAAVACSDTVRGNDIIGILLTPSSVSVGVRASTPLVLYAVYEGGTAPRGDGIAWTTSDASIASVDEQGNVHGESLGGPVTITATRNGQEAEALVTVIPASVEITPRISTLPVGASVQFSATALDHSGSLLATPAPTWAVSSTSGDEVASITADGRLTIQSPGAIIVVASISGQQGQLDISVPSAFDGAWSGVTSTGGTVDFVVQYGVVSSFRLANTLRQACSRQLLNLQTAVIGADNRFALSHPGFPSLVTGAFAGPASMSGAYGDIPAFEGCPANSEGAVPSATFTASR